MNQKQHKSQDQGGCYCITVVNAVISGKADFFVFFNHHSFKQSPRKTVDKQELPVYNFIFGKGASGNYGTLLIQRMLMVHLIVMLSAGYNVRYHCLLGL